MERAFKVKIIAKLGGYQEILPVGDTVYLEVGSKKKGEQDVIVSSSGLRFPADNVCAGIISYPEMFEKLKTFTPEEYENERNKKTIQSS